jgi:hypothetical protein
MSSRLRPLRRGDPRTDPGVRASSPGSDPGERVGGEGWRDGDDRDHVDTGWASLVVTVNAPDCRDPLTRAATLLHTPGALVLTGASGLAVRASLSSRWGDELAVLLPPDPLVEPGDSRLLVSLDAPTRSVGPAGIRCQQGRLHGTAVLSPLSAAAREAAAEHLDGRHSEVANLPDAGANSARIVALRLITLSWQICAVNLPLDPVEVLEAEVDEVLRWSVSLCEHLNADHTDVARRLVGRDAWLAEVDRFGATLGLFDGPHPFARVLWSRPCGSLHDLHHVLVHGDQWDAGHRMSDSTAIGVVALPGQRRG